MRVIHSLALEAALSALVHAQAAPSSNTHSTAVPAIKVGRRTRGERPAGCTVIIVDGEGAAGGVAQRGGAPGTRETDLLDPRNLVDKGNAVGVAGGSAFGLDASQGVMGYLEERKIGWNVGSAGVVPIVPSAILFDLGF